MRKWIVYRHTSPSGKIYIGITSRSSQARWGNNGHTYKNCVVFYKAIMKYGWDNIKHEVLFTELSEEKAKHLEIELIRHYKNLGISYNVTDGGDGALGRTVSEETRAKQRAARLGKPLSEEHLTKIREARKKQRGIPRSEETKKKLHEANKGKKPSVKTIEALKAYNASYPLTEERLKKMREAADKVGYKSQTEVLTKNRIQIGIKHRKAVVQLSLDGQYINDYDGTKFAAAATQVDNSSIVRCCKGKQKTAGGFIWIYLSDYTIPSSIKEFSTGFHSLGNREYLRKH